MVAAYFLPWQPLQNIKGQMTNWIVVISAATVAMGFVYMTTAQIKLYQKNKTTLQLIYTITPYVFFTGFALSAVLYPGGSSSPEYQWWFGNIYSNVGATIYAIMFFTLASSAYRTFRVSSIEAIALIAGGMIYTLRQIPLFQVYTPWIVPLGEWFLLVPNTGGGRGAVIAAALAALVVGIRTLWGKEATLEVQG
jgi:general stress protein CsbA